MFSGTAEYTHEYFLVNRKTLMKKAGRRRGTRSVVRGLLPAIEPYEQGMLAVSDGNLVYWETCGNPLGKPALVHRRPTGTRHRPVCAGPNPDAGYGTTQTQRRRCEVT